MLQQSLFFSSLLASLCVFGAAKDLFENLDVAAAIAGQVPGVTIQTVNIDLSTLTTVSNSSVGISQAIQASGAESAPTASQRVFTDSENSKANAAASANSDEIIRLTAQLAKKLAAAGVSSGLYKSEAGVVALSNEPVLPGSTPIAVTATEIEDLAAKIVRLASPGTNVETDDANLVIIDCPNGKCDQSKLTSKGLTEVIKEQLTDVAGQGKGPNSGALPSSAPGNHTDCNLMVMSVGRSTSADDAVNAVREFLKNNGMRCVTGVCPQIQSNDKNLMIDECERLPNGSCKFSCPSGMRIVGPAQVTCREAGLWSAPPPICIIENCPIPATTDHLKINWNKCRAATGSSCEFTCEDGWELIGPQSVTCQAGSTWSASIPTCKEPECDPRNDPVNGAINCYGTTCAYTCNDGFHLHGATTIKCNPGGKWSNAAPFCTQSEALCTPPAAPANGAVGSCGNKVGDTCTITCNSPYKAVGATNLGCCLGAMWSDKPAKCVPASEVPDLFLGNEAMEVEDAVNYCQNHNGRLMAIKDKNQNEKVVNFLNNNYPDKMVWLSANDKVSEGSWRWGDGTPVTYNQWMESYPIPDTQSHKYDCSAIWDRLDYNWVSICCDEKLYPLCEYIG